MISEKQKQILLLLASSKYGFNVNQIARNLNISVSWAHETLKNLTAQNILIATKIANSILFTINWKNPKTQILIDLILLDHPKLNPEIKEIVNSNIEKTTNKAISEIPQQLKIKSYGIKQETTVQNSVYTPIFTTQPIASQGYKGSIATSNFSYGNQQTGYNIAPIGNTGVSNVLGSYAASGAFGGYSKQQTPTGGWYGSSGAPPVPPATLGSKVSDNISNFTLGTHTSQHKNSTMAGCQYCSAGPSQIVGE
ncbi:winged helix-turn-helix transcriptional regulator [Candidatus Woesearchaeota archaeon]|nr:winged helix-turn-helix transcriptional regulator [Candidatus Woesearchaeota archaeon]